MERKGKVQQRFIEELFKFQRYNMAHYNINILTKKSVRILPNTPTYKLSFRNLPE